MEISTASSPSRATMWAGRIISWICVLFLLFDALTKIFREAHTVSACATIGWPESSFQGVGTILLCCTVFYMIPRTAVLGAILVTAYLGGATAINFRVDASYVFPILFGILIWTGLALRVERVRLILLGNKS